VWDGALAELVRKTRPEKRIKLKLTTPAERSDFEQCGGRLMRLEGVEAELLVSHDAMQTAITTLLSKLKVVDLTVEDPPLEEVLGDLFEEVAT
jgi:ABC-2 type transport system ATP-binding protein